MKATNKASQANDYAIAKALNDLVNGIVLQLCAGNAYDFYTDNDIEGLNRAYILLTHELAKIYSRNQELLAIQPEPIWRRFEILKGGPIEEIASYVADTEDFGYAHNLKVEKLCVIAGIDAPVYTPEQHELIKTTDLITSQHAKKVKAAIKNEKKPEKEYGWEIMCYYLTYKPDGTILINDVLKLKKVHAGSITEKLLEQSIKTPDTKFKPDLGKTSRNLSTIISSAGFTPVLRDLFFPTVSGDAIVFRRLVSREQAILERIDTEELDLRLKENGAVGRVVFEPN